MDRLPGLDEELSGEIAGLYRDIMKAISDHYPPHPGGTRVIESSDVLAALCLCVAHAIAKNPDRDARAQEMARYTTELPDLVADYLEVEAEHDAEKPRH